MSIEHVAAPAEIAERLGPAADGPNVVRRENWCYASDGTAEFPVRAGVAFAPWMIAEGTVPASAREGRREPSPGPRRPVPRSRV